jgi:hypothetical protein
MIVRCLGMCRISECTLSEGEHLLSPLDVEADLCIVGIDDGFSGAQEWAPQDDGCSLVTSGLYHHEVCRDI